MPQIIATRPGVLGRIREAPASRPPLPLQGKRRSVVRILLALLLIVDTTAQVLVEIGVLVDADKQCQFAAGGLGEDSLLALSELVQAGGGEGCASGLQEVAVVEFDRELSDPMNRVG